MCGLTNASTKVVTARSYSRYSGSTTQDSDSMQSGCSTAEVQPSADFADEMERHDALRLHPEVRIAVTFRHGLTRDLQEMAEACGDDEAESADWTLQQRVCGNGCAVGEAGDLGRRLVDCVEDLAHAANEADSRIGGRARNLRDAHGARGTVDANDVGEGAAGIDANAQTRLVGRR